MVMETSASRYANRKVLVTGAGGFIGSHLVERLVRVSGQVRALVRYNSRNDWGLLADVPPEVRETVEIVPGDVRDPYFVRKAVKGVDTVFHLASLIAIPYSYMAPETYVSTNVGGALNILEACLAEGVGRVVHTSTSECYGSAQYVPIDEKHPLQGQSPYSASKIGADMIAESYWRSFGLPVATIRPFNTFGPRQSARAIIPTIITQALTGNVVCLGSLAPCRDFTFVDDTVDAFLEVGVVHAAVGQVINVGSGRDISIGRLVELILSFVGGDVRIEVEKRRVRPERSEVERLLCDNGKARAVLGWCPQTSLEDGLRRTIDWLTRHRERYKAHLYNV